MKLPKLRELKEAVIALIKGPYTTKYPFQMLNCSNWFSTALTENKFLLHPGIYGFSIISSEVKFLSLPYSLLSNTVLHTIAAEYTVLVI